MKVLTHLDLNQNELRNAILQPLAAAPETGKLGQLYYDSQKKAVYQYDGEAWVPIGSKIEVGENGKLTVDGKEMDVYKLPTATEDTLGGVKGGGNVEIAEDGTLSYDIATYVGMRESEEDDNTAITRILAGSEPHEGDIAVVKTLISGDKYSYAAFVYDTEQWVAMDGNVDATNVIMRQDIVTAGNYTQVGNVTKGATATGSISVAGKSVAEVFQAIFTKEQNPTATQPAVTITFNQAGAKEVGTQVTPTYSCSLSAGSYTYGPATGITAQTWEVTDTNSNSESSASGSFPAFTVEDSTNYKITAKATHGDGAVPKTNLGNNYAAAQIKAGTKSKDSGTVTGYRSFFYGSLTTVPEAVDSAVIRGLTNANKAVGASQKFNMSIVEGAKVVYIAFPSSTKKTLSKVADQNAFGTDIVASFTSSTVSVEGANGATAVEYTLYTYAPSTALGANTYEVTIA